MYSLIFLGLVSCAVSLLLTPLVRFLARRFGVVDQPDHKRKIHQVPIPRLGGVVIIVAAAGAYSLLLLVHLSAGHIVRSGVPFAIRLLPALGVIFCIGLIDDVFQIRAWYKLSAQIAAAALAWVSGIHLISVGGYSLPMAVSFAVTIIWIVACSNAINLIDGVDGLAVGVSLFATITTTIAALLHNNMELAYATVPLAGALLGFLRYNFNPASIFLGDCGSLTIGFLLGCYGIVWSEKSTTLLSTAAPLFVLSIPLLDAGLAIVRRFLRQQPIFVADRAHIHHKLLAKGLTPRRVVLVLYIFCGFAGAAGLVLTATRSQYQSFVVVMVFLAALVGIRKLGYNEFGVASKLAFGGAFQRLLSAQLVLEDFEEKVTACNSLQQCWEVLSRESPRFGFSGIKLQVDDEVWQKSINQGWHIRVDVPDLGYINLMRESNATSTGSAAVLFVDCISRIFVPKLKELHSALSGLSALDEAEESLSIQSTRFTQPKAAIHVSTEEANLSPE
jgi:UDP-GlcNAc:undecaprenyl-phosphate GlcNAc-1-phosphate transferase